MKGVWFKDGKRIVFRNVKSVDLEEVGRLYMENGRLRFEGDVEAVLEMVLGALKEELVKLE